LTFTKHTLLPYIAFFALLIIVICIAATSSNTINWAGLGIVFFFYLLIFGVGIWSGKKGDDTSSDSFLLAGRKLPLGIAMLTMAATWLGGGYINGTAEAAAQSGLVWVQAPWGYGFSLIIGGLFFARKMRRYQFRTMLDPLSQRFGEKSAGLFFIPAVLGETFWIAAILTALGTTFSVIIGLDTQSSIIASAIIAILYTTMGGLWSVVYTDMVQLALIVIGLVLVVPFILTDVGGVDVLWTTYEAKFGSSASLIPDKEAMGDYFWNWLDFALLLIFGGIPWQVYFQRVLASRNENTAMWLSISAGVICLLVAIPAALIGMVGAVTDWSSLGLLGPETPASTLPYVLQHLTPSIIALIGLGAIAAAVMSSIDSSMLSASTLTAWNVYKPLFKPEMDHNDLKKVVQRSIIIIGIAATILSLKVESVYALWYLCSDFVYCLLFPALATAMFDPKANRIGVLSGFAVAAFLRFGGGDPTLHLPVLLPYPMIEEGVVLFPFRTLSMLSGLLTIIVVSRLTQKMNPPKPLQMVQLG
jgi:high affinity choline transporter 7